MYMYMWWWIYAQSLSYIMWLMISKPLVKYCHKYEAVEENTFLRTPTIFIGNCVWSELYTAIRFLWVSAKFCTCTVLSVNGILALDKMPKFKGECAHFSFNKGPIYTHGSARAKFSTNWLSTVDSVISGLCKGKFSLVYHVSCIFSPKYLSTASPTHSVHYVIFPWTAKVILIDVTIHVTSNTY